MALQSTSLMMTDADYFTLSQSALVYSIDELDHQDVDAFLQFIRAKKESGWTPEMIETHLIANISARVKRLYPKLRKYQCDIIAEEMIQAMLERILNEQNF